MIILILFIVLLELLQILSSKSKVAKWILPVISFLNSINIVLGMIVFEGKNYISFENIIGNIIVFLICNIPTIIFITTNYIMQKKQNLDKKFFKYIKISILIILAILIAFTFFIVKKTNDITKTNKETVSTTINTTISTIMITNKENIDITNSSQMKFQKDYSLTIESIINTNKIKDKIYSEYGTKGILDIQSMNEYNTMYKLTFQWENLDKDKCIDAHNKYNKELIDALKSVYQLEVSIVDSTSISI